MTGRHYLIQILQSKRSDEEIADFLEVIVNLYGKRYANRKQAIADWLSDTVNVPRPEGRKARKEL